MRPSLLPLLGLLVFAAGCKSGSPEAASNPATFPELGTGKPVAEGVVRHEVQVQGHRLWIYLPTNKPKEMPLVVIAPAGSPLIHGMSLGDGDVDEHLPYVKAGYAVVAYEISGPVKDNPSEAEMLAGAKDFQAAQGGLTDAKTALDYAFAKLSVDKKHVLTAGHSSAATLSLLVAARDPRITACIAYAPATDIPKRLGTEATTGLDSALSGFSAFLKDISPSNNVDKLKCPVFIFQAEDDTNVPIVDTAAFVEELKKHNANVTFEKVPTGGHYDPMIRQGIADAIKWAGK